MKDSSQIGQGAFTGKSTLVGVKVTIEPAFNASIRFFAGNLEDDHRR